MIEFPPYRLDLHAGRLWHGEEPVALRPKAWALLCYLAERPGILVTKDELHMAVWGDTIVSDDTLTRTRAAAGARCVSSRRLEERVCRRPPGQRHGEK